MLMVAVEKDGWWCGSGGGLGVGGGGGGGGCGSPCLWETGSSETKEHGHLCPSQCIRSSRLQKIHLGVRLLHLKNHIGFRLLPILNSGQR